jgi:hypothetical protein
MRGKVALAAHFASAVPAHANVLGFSAPLASSGGDGFRLQTVHSKTLASVRDAMGNSAPPPWRSMRRWALDLLCGLAHLQANGALHLFVGVGDIFVADDGHLVVGSIGSARAVPKGATCKIAAAEAAALVSVTRNNIGRAAPEMHGAIRTGAAADIARQVEFALGKMLLDLVYGAQAHPLAKYNGATSWCGATYYERKLATVFKRLGAIDGYPASFADLVRSLLRRDPTERTALAAARDAAERLAIGGDPPRTALHSLSGNSAAESAAESVGPAAHDALALNAGEVAALRDELDAVRLKYKAAKALYREAQDADALTAALVAAKKRTEDVERKLSETRTEARDAFVAAAAAREETLVAHAAQKNDLLAELAQTKQELVSRCFAMSGEGSGGGVDPSELELLKNSLLREQRSRTSLALEMKRLREDAADERQRALAERALVDQQLIRARNEVASLEGAERRRRIAEEATAQQREAEIDTSLKMVASTRADMRDIKQQLNTRAGELAAALARTDDANAAAEEAQQTVERLQMEKRAIQLECVAVALQRMHALPAQRSACQAFSLSLTLSLSSSLPPSRL